jgi:gamma-glutamyltranspeptidase/glutathione hydrolase
MVSAADPRAAAAGAEMLRAGGSAADAALATLLALTVVEPQSSGIGGGGFLVYEDGDGTPATYDGRETAPMATTGTWFFKDGKPMDTAEAIPGGKSVGVPGNIRLMADAHRDQGRLPWARLFGPALRLARAGFAIAPWASSSSAWRCRVPTVFMSAPMPRRSPPPSMARRAIRRA